jgi:hypothetical protein
MTKQENSRDLTIFVNDDDEDFFDNTDLIEMILEKNKISYSSDNFEDYYEDDDGDRIYFLKNCFFVNECDDELINFFDKAFGKHNNIYFEDTMYDD